MVLEDHLLRLARIPRNCECIEATVASVPLARVSLATAAASASQPVDDVPVAQLHLEPDVRRQLAGRTVYFIRHAESKHQAYQPAHPQKTTLKNHPEKWTDRRFIDSPLSAAGRAQACGLAQRLATVQLTPDLLVCSPLARALQTAQLGLKPFAEHALVTSRLLEERVGSWGDVSFYDDGSGRGFDEFLRAHPAITAAFAGGVRESRSRFCVQVGRRFAVNEHGSPQESKERLQRRIDTWWRWLGARGTHERVVVVVTHSKWMRSALGIECPENTAVYRASFV